jgi:Eco57I restriction-modification methylase
LRNESEINPDVLGYIFEKYVNQKQMGAYYTKEDITEYISKNTIIPFLFDRAQKLCANAFDARDGIWKLLREQPDRYIYAAVKHGITVNALEAPPHRLDEPIALPPVITAGLDDVSKRTEWNKTAPAEYGLPTETWREVMARRKRYEEVHAKLLAGEVTQINDLITLNLDIRQFAQDVLAAYEGSDLIAAFYRAIAGRVPERSNEEFEQGLSVLDPTCGSGAFLFAALNVLEPLVETCIERMRSFVEEANQQGRTTAHRFFRRVLTETDKHLNVEYFIIKSIIIGNLYGVDIIEEATEICKLRLFLKLVAHVERDDRRSNKGLEPLPDIDFNIRAGNTLVGFTSLDEAKRATANKLDWEAGKTLTEIDEGAREADHAYKLFREMQVVHGLQDSKQHEFKSALRERLASLAAKLDRYLAEVYGKDPYRQKEFEAWRKSHQPFHWYTEFYGIITSGGFDVIIGNPPYLETREVDYETHGLTSAETSAIHAMCIERSLQLLSKQGCISMIVPLALVSTQRMRVVQNMLENGCTAWYSNYSWRPGKLFDTVNRALTIFVAAPAKDPETFSTNYQKWNSDSRDYLMPCVSFVDVPRKRPAFWVPKASNEIERKLLSKCLKIKTTVQHFTGRTEHRVYYRTTGGLYWKVFTDFAPAFNINGKKGSSTRETWFTLSKATMVKPLVAILSSDIFWWWYTLTSNLRDLNPYDVQNFPVPVSAVNDTHLAQLGHKYLKELQRNSTMLVRNQRQTGRTETQSFKIQKSKPTIDEIDRLLAVHYGFTDEELDFIINYDIKYRMGSAESEE